MSESIEIPSNLNGLSSEAQSRAEAEGKASENEERKEMLLKSILTSEANARLSRIKLVRPDKYNKSQCK